MNILYLTERFPHPLHDGGSQRTYHVLRALAREHTVTLLADSDPTPRGGDPEFLNPICRTQFVTPGPSSANLWANALRLGPGQSLWRLKNCSPRFRQAAQQLIATGDFSAVHFNQLDTAWHLLEGDWPDFSVFDSHNSLHTYFADRAESSRGFHRWLWQRESRLLAEIEARVVRRASQTVVCSETDAQCFSRLAPQVQSVVIANGVDTTEIQPGSSEAVVPGTLLFIGNMGYFPNSEATTWFLEHVSPKLPPGLRFLTVGANLPPALQARADGTTFVAPGRVPDVRPYLDSAEIYVVPLQNGSGTRLKILEAMAAGKAIITTTKGAEGIPLQHGVEVLFADSPAEFLNAIQKLHSHPRLRKHMGDAARALAEQQFDWQRIGDQWLEIYRSAQR